jgi:hypothetical protein
MGESVLKKIFPTLIYCAPDGRRLNKARATNARFSRITSSPPPQTWYACQPPNPRHRHDRRRMGPVLVFYGEGSRASCSCDGIYDCRFGLKPHQYLHCCRIEYLRRVQ